jgi:hypothetical protein
MISKSMYLASVALAGLSCVPLLAQEKSARGPEVFTEGRLIQLPVAPSYMNISDGLVISSMRSEMHQPLASPETDVTLRIEYLRVNAFQLPSYLVPDIGSTGAIDYRLNNRQVSLLEWPKRR